MMLIIINAGVFMNQWEADIQDWDSIDKERAKFAFEQANLELNATIEAKKNIEDKAFKLLTLLVSVLLLSLGSFIKIVESGHIHYHVIIPLFVFSLAISAVIFGIIKILKPLKYMLQGNEPKNLWIEAFLTQNDVQFYYSLSLNQQEAIDENRKNNLDKSRLFRVIINFTIGSMLFSFFLWALLFIIAFVF